MEEWWDWAGSILDCKSPGEQPESLQVVLQSKQSFREHSFRLIFIDSNKPYWNLSQGGSCVWKVFRRWRSISYGCCTSGQQKTPVYKRGLLASYWEKVLQEPQRCRFAMVFSSLMEENRLVLFSRNAFSQAAEGAGFTCKQKLPSAGRNRDAFSHLLWDQGRELLGRDGFQTADVISSAHHCIAVDVWEATAFGTHLP